MSRNVRVALWLLLGGGTAILHGRDLCYRTFGLKVFFATSAASAKVCAVLSAVLVIIIIIIIIVIPVDYTHSHAYNLLATAIHYHHHHRNL